MGQILQGSTAKISESCQLPIASVGWQNCFRRKFPVDLSPAVVVMILNVLLGKLRMIDKRMVLLQTTPLSEALRKERQVESGRPTITNPASTRIERYDRLLWRRPEFFLLLFCNSKSIVK